MKATTSYLGAFLKHPTNQMALLASGVAAIFASMPFGWSGMALVGVLALGTEILAALTLPSLPSFRAAVDREQQRRRRDQLMIEIQNSDDAHALNTYQHMHRRVQALYRTANDSRTTLTRQDVEKLEDLTVDYLNLCVVHLSLKRRKDPVSEEVVSKRIEAIQAQLSRSDLPIDEVRQLRGALAQYSDAMQRSRRLAVRRSALEATLMAMPDKMEEVYQLVITSPYSTGMGGKLEESLARLRIAEEVEAEFDEPMAYEVDTPPLTSSPNATSNNTARRSANVNKV